jgi:hypothetical protein
VQLTDPCVFHNRTRNGSPTSASVGTTGLRPIFSPPARHPAISRDFRLPGRSARRLEPARGDDPGFNFNNWKIITL